MEQNTESNISLDNLDKKILYLLDHNARLTFSELARTLKQGRDRVEYRIKRLEELGVISGYKTIVNLSKLGLTLYKTYLRFGGEESRRRKFIATLAKEKKVFWVVECDGAWDLIVSIAAESPVEFYEEQGRILGPVSDIIINSSVLTVVNFWIFRKKYFQASGTHFLHVGEVPKKVQLDQIDFNILLELSQNARITICDLAKICNSSPALINYHLQKLEKEKIIVGYRTEIDLEKINRTFFKCQLYLNSFDLKKEKKLFSFCNKHPDVTEYIQQIGECRNEIELQTPTYFTYNKFIDELRNEFPNEIRNISTILINKGNMRWFPTCYQCHDYSNESF